VKEPQRELEVTDRGVIGYDDGEPLSQRLVHGGQQQTARLDGEAGQFNASLVDSPDDIGERGMVEHAPAERCNQRFVASLGHWAREFNLKSEE
jgi:hypothetical protein